MIPIVVMAIRDPDASKSLRGGLRAANLVRRMSIGARDRMRALTKAPAALIVLRMVIAPLLVLDALDGSTGTGFLLGFSAAVLSDVFDGMLARHLGVANAALRQADSLADVVLYLAVLATAWLAHREVVLMFLWPLTEVLAVQVLAGVVAAAKFGRISGYHAYSAKVWGITLFVATCALFGWDAGGITLWIAIIFGVVSSLEDMAISLVLPTWTHDVPSIIHALRLRRAARRQQGACLWTQKKCVQS